MNEVLLANLLENKLFKNNISNPAVVGAGLSRLQTRFNSSALLSRPLAAVLSQSGGIKEGGDFFSPITSVTGESINVPTIYNYRVEPSLQAIPKRYVRNRTCVQRKVFSTQPLRTSIASNNLSNELQFLPLSQLHGGVTHIDLLTSFVEIVLDIAFPTATISEWGLPVGNTRTFVIYPKRNAHLGCFQNVYIDLGAGTSTELFQDTMYEWGLAKMLQRQTIPCPNNTYREMRNISTSFSTDGQPLGWNTCCANGYNTMEQAFNSYGDFTNQKSYANWPNTEQFNNFFYPHVLTYLNYQPAIDNQYTTQMSFRVPLKEFLPTTNTDFLTATSAFTMRMTINTNIGYFMNITNRDDTSQAVNVELQPTNYPTITLNVAKSRCFIDGYLAGKEFLNIETRKQIDNDYLLNFENYRLYRKSELLTVQTKQFQVQFSPQTTPMSDLPLQIQHRFIPRQGSPLFYSFPWETSNVLFDLGNPQTAIPWIKSSSLFPATPANTTGVGSTARNWYGVTPLKFSIQQIDRFDVQNVHGIQERFSYRNYYPSTFILRFAFTSFLGSQNYVVFNEFDSVLCFDRAKYIRDHMYGGQTFYSSSFNSNFADHSTFDTLLSANDIFMYLTSRKVNGSANFQFVAADVGNRAISQYMYNNFDLVQVVLHEELVKVNGVQFKSLGANGYLQTAVVPFQPFFNFVY